MMRTMNLSAKRLAVCAFCVHWYDPTNSHINPKNPRTNSWEYDPDARCKCMIRGVEKSGFSYCSKYECKIKLN